MVFILRFLICLITLGPRIVRIELVIWKNLNKMQFRYWGANNCGYKCTYRLSKNSSGTKSCLCIGRKAVEFDNEEYQKFKYHRYVQKSYVPSPLRAPITTWEQTQTFLVKKSTFVSCYTMWRNSIYLKSMLIKAWV